MHRYILHVHIPALPIAVARVLTPCLRNRPVAVALPESPRARVLSVSSEARQEGIFKGMVLTEALKRCPDLRMLPPNAERVDQACRHMARIAAQYTPLWEIPRPGHTFLDLTGTQRLWGTVQDTAFRLRQDIRTGLSLMGTVGVAGNKMVAGIASCSESDDGMVHVDTGWEAVFLAPLRVERLPGIGQVRRRILKEELHIRRIGQLAKMDPDRLKLIFGARAPVIHERALGIDPTPVYPSSRTPLISETAPFPGDEVDDTILLKTLYRLVARCAFRMRKQGLIPEKAGLLVRYADHREARRRTSLSPDPGMPIFDGDLYGPLEALFFRACHRRVRVRLIKVWFWDFERPDRQLSLFPAASPDREKRRSITRALDRIQDRYGEGAIRYGRAA